MHISAAQGGLCRGALVGQAGEQSPRQGLGSSRTPRRGGTQVSSPWALRELQGGPGGAGEMEIQGEMKGLVLLKFSSFVVFVL